jgi:hypothetical protein
MPKLKKSVEERFWDNVQKGEGCWEWIGTKCLSGYGRIKTNYKRISAHRFMWELRNGPIPKLENSYHGICVLHRCDNPSCVNPDHLFLGTNRDNSIDRDKKGRNKGSVVSAERKRSISHCPKGHPYDGDNLILRKNGRRCRECQREFQRNYMRKRYWKLKAENLAPAQRAGGKDGRRSGE